MVMGWYNKNKEMNLRHNLKNKYEKFYVSQAAF